MKIIPAILETDSELVAEKLADVISDGRLDTIQLDILDGTLSPQLTVTPYDLAGLDWGELRVDFHLMTEDPLDYVWELAAQNPSLPVRAVAGQVERMSEQKAFLEAIKERGWQAGLALDLDTPLESIDDHVWGLLDQLVLMSVPLGRQGQAFDEHVLTKLHELTHIMQEYSLKTEILVDGGIKPAELAQLGALGVGACAVGSFLWQGDYHERVEALLAASDE
ncbi:hypothetical protein IJJ08_04260 [bacterium]|nr:hypothetical protein [bacterium]